MPNTETKHCEKCRNEIPILNLNETDKKMFLEIFGKSPIESAIFLRSKINFTLENSKLIIAHTNKEYGKCSNCNFDGLTFEYQACPKCKSLNTNWK